MEQQLALRYVRRCHDGGNTIYDRGNTGVCIIYDGATLDITPLIMPSPLPIGRDAPGGARTMGGRTGSKQSPNTPISQWKDHDKSTPVRDPDVEAARRAGGRGRSQK